MTRWGFKGLPASHGQSLSHRSAGSTGQCQDPGRVFKGKKMAGRGSNIPTIMKNLTVYKMDYARSLLYIVGSIQGANGSLLRIIDNLICKNNNDELINFPTFVYEEGKEYANIIEMEPSKNDPGENWLHENAIVKDDDDAGED